MESWSKKGAEGKGEGPEWSGALGVISFIEKGDEGRDNE